AGPGRGCGGARRAARGARRAPRGGRGAPRAVRRSGAAPLPRGPRLPRDRRPPRDDRADGPDVGRPRARQAQGGPRVMSPNCEAIPQSKGANPPRLALRFIAAAAVLVAVAGLAAVFSRPSARVLYGAVAAASGPALETGARLRSRETLSSRGPSVVALADGSI